MARSIHFIVAVFFANSFMKAFAFVLASGILLSGCAFGRKNIRLETEFSEVSMSIPVRNGFAVVIDKVDDIREFSPDNGLAGPSVGLSRSLARLDESEHAKARLVGRIGNGYGMPCGDVIAANTTVADHVKLIVEQALTDVGFEIVSDEKSDTIDAIHVSVTIDNFWGWMCYAYCANANISVRLEREGTCSVVSVNANNSCAAIWGSSSEWRNLFVKNADKLRENLASQLHLMAEKFK